MASQDDYQVRLSSFQGPLDLLLYLIRRAEVDIEAIPIHEITEQYFAFLNQIDRIDIDLAGEFLAMAASLEHLAQTTGNATAQILADTLDAATGSVLTERRSPGRKVHELDNRGSHFYLAMYWAQELAKQTDDPALAAKFAPIAEALTANETAIVDELNAVQGDPVDIGGYYYPDAELVTAAMRPSATFNGIIDAI